MKRDVNLSPLGNPNHRAWNFRRAPVLRERLDHHARSAVRFGEPLCFDDVQLEIELSVPESSRGAAVVVSTDSGHRGMARFSAATGMRISKADRRKETAENNRCEEVHWIPQGSLKGSKVGTYWEGSKKNRSQWQVPCCTCDSPRHPSQSNAIYLPRPAGRRPASRRRAYELLRPERRAGARPPSRRGARGVRSRTRPPRPVRRVHGAQARRARL